MTHWADRCLTLLFPPRCLACGRHLPLDAARRREVGPWCRTCWEGLRPGRWPHCPRCAAVRSLSPAQAPQPATETASACPLCRGDRLHFDSAHAIGDYTGLLKELVVRMKNVHDDVLAMRLGQLLGRTLAAETVPLPDLVLPIPLHWRRRLQRGFAAAEIIGCEVARTHRGTYRGDLLRCLRQTRKQGLLSAEQRRLNVRGAFGVSDARAVVGRSILLVDDVMTTGATASEAAAELKRAGAGQVAVAVLARGTGRR